MEFHGAEKIIKKLGVSQCKQILAENDQTHSFCGYQVIDRIFQELLRPRGRPRLETPKERINIRLSYEVIQHFKSSGAGWQTRIDAALREFIQSKPNSGLRR